MINKITNPKVKLIMNSGIKISFIIAVVAVFILELYCENSIPFAFYIGMSLFKSSMFYIVMFIICGCVFNKINV